MQGSQPEDPTLFETVNNPSGGAGVAKIPFGWFPLQSARLDGDTLALTISVEKQLPPTKDDIRIINRSIELLADLKTWNKNDDRTCPPNPQRWSMFCALMQATEEVSGSVHYRQPALQAVREVFGGNRVSKHRLMDYNNHPDTTLVEIHNLLRTAQGRLPLVPSLSAFESPGALARTTSGRGPLQRSCDFSNQVAGAGGFEPGHRCGHASV